MKFVYAVKEFFNSNLPDSYIDKIKTLFEVKTKCYENAIAFSNRKPNLYMRFAYTGKFDATNTNTSALDTIKEEIEKTDLLNKVVFSVADRPFLQAAYKRANASVQREIELARVITLPKIQNVDQSFLAVVPATEYVKLLRDEHGYIIRPIFYENIRDYDAKSQINANISATIENNEGDRFVIRNNGITILAENIVRAGDAFTLINYQIINGCQTSHVIHQSDDKKLSNVFIPIKLIHSRDESIISSTIISSNSQNDVRPEQFWSLMPGQKEIEDFFSIQKSEKALHYERRAFQFAGDESVERVRIVTPQNLARQFAAIFLNEPHTAGRYYREIQKWVDEGRIFHKDHKPHSYYAAGYLAYRLEWLFRNDARIDKKWKVFRYHLLNGFRLLVCGDKLPAVNSAKIEGQAISVADKAIETEAAVGLFQ